MKNLRFSITSRCRAPGLILAALVVVSATVSMVGGCGGSTAVDGTPTTSAAIGGGKLGDCPDCKLGGLPVSDETTQVSWNQRQVVAEVTAQVDADSKIHLIGKDGRSFSEEQLKKLVQNLPKDGKSALEVRLVTPQATAAPGSPQENADTRIGCYYVRLSWEKHYVGSCIKKDSWHLGFQVKNTCKNTEYFNAHACVWSYNGLNFGLYNSTNQWCAKATVSYSAIKNAISAGLVAVGIYGLTNTAISYFGATVIVAAFAL